MAPGYSNVPAVGRSMPNPLPLIGRWRIFDNLRRAWCQWHRCCCFCVVDFAGAWRLELTDPGLWSPSLLSAPLLDRTAQRVRGSVQGWRARPRMVRWQ
jgi:hypothetical protein